MPVTDPFNTWSAILTQWSFRPVLLLIILLLGWLHSRGMRVSRQDPLESIGEGHHVRPFYASIFVLFLSLISPVDRLGNDIFFIRVAQHILLISIFPALFMASDSLPVFYAGLPQRVQKIVDRFCLRLYPFMEQYLTKGICWLIMICCVWIWYDPALVGTLIAYPALRNLELGMMLFGAMLHWWHVNAARPRLHPRLPSFAHMGYTLAGAGPLKIPGLFFLFSISSFYPYAPINFLSFEISPLLSQQIGGAVVWLLAGTVYTFSFARFFSSWLEDEEAKPPRPLEEWDNPETFRAPHLEQQD